MILSSVADRNWIGHGEEGVYAKIEDSQDTSFNDPAERSRFPEKRWTVT